MTYGISLVSGAGPCKIDALNEAIRRYGALPVIHLIEYPSVEAALLVGDAPATAPEPKRITFKRERRSDGYYYVEQK